MELEVIVAEPSEGRFVMSTGGFICTLSFLLDEETKKATFWDDLGKNIHQANLGYGDKIKIFGTWKERWWTNTGGQKSRETYFSAYRLQLLEKYKEIKISETCCRDCQLFPDKCLVGLCYDSLSERADMRICTMDKLCVMDKNKECWIRK